MTEPSHRIDYADLPTPAERLMVTLFNHRPQCCAVPGLALAGPGRHGRPGGEPVHHQGDQSGVGMNPGGPPAPDKPCISVIDHRPGDTTSIFLNLRVAATGPVTRHGRRKGPTS
jgi:hypothetical protein